MKRILPLYKQDIEMNQISTWIWSTIMDYIPFIPSNIKRRFDPRGFLFKSAETLDKCLKIKEYMYEKKANIPTPFYYKLKDNISLDNETIYLNELSNIEKKILVFYIAEYNEAVYKKTLSLFSKNFSRIIESKNFADDDYNVIETYTELEPVIDTLEKTIDELVIADDFMKHFNINSGDFAGSNQHKHLLLILGSFKWYYRFCLNIINMNNMMNKSKDV